MSESWGPRAHPERCDDEWLDDATKTGGRYATQDRMRQMKTGEQILTVIVIFSIIAAALVWLTWRWGW